MGLKQMELDLDMQFIRLNAIPEMGIPFFIFQFV